MKLKLLKDRNFFLLMMGKLVSLIGTRAQSFALSLYVLNITGSATKFASVLAVTFLPRIILGPIAGVFVDWFDRKKIIVVLDFIRGITIGIFTIIFMSKGSFSMTEIYVLVIIMAMASLAFQPAIATVIPSIVEKDDLMDANAMNSIIMNMGELAAPAIAGLIFGIFGLPAILIINSISFILSGISEMFIKIRKSNRKPKKIGFKVFKRDFIEGFEYIKNKKVILNIVIMGTFVNVLFEPMGGIGRVFIAKEVLGFTNSQFGFIEAVVASSVFVAPIGASWISKRMELGKIFKLNLMIIPIYGIILAFVTTDFFMSRFSGGLVPYIMYGAIGFITIFTSSVGNISLRTLMQKEIDLKVMGRVSTTMGALARAIIPLGKLGFGKLFDNFAPALVICIGVIPMFFLALIFGKNLYGHNVEEVELKEQKACS